MTQTRMQSLIEALMNVAIGFGINFAFNFVILPIVGLPMPSLQQNFVMGILFTIVSVARSYLIRRFFNSKLKAMAEMLSEKVA